MGRVEGGDPRRIGNYAIRGRLGQGAMGTVYLGLSPGGRSVALKVVRAELARDPEFRDRFRLEIDSARAVGGFWTAAVVDADPSAEQPWLATEYVPGPTLAEAVERHGPLPEPALRRLAAGLAEALAAIHAAGLLHRDLKPSNVLLAADGPRVIDFGIAKAVHAAHGVTGTGMVVGTPGFLSPEQIEGGEVGPASDVFALGSVLVHAATARPPFGDTGLAATLFRIVQGQPDLEGMPPVLGAIASRCLDPRPGARPTPGDLLAEIGHPEHAEWLPDAVRDLVEEHRTRVLAPVPRSDTRVYTGLAPADAVRTDEHADPSGGALAEEAPTEWIGPPARGAVPGAPSGVDAGQVRTGVSGTAVPRRAGTGNTEAPPPVRRGSRDEVVTRGSGVRPPARPDAAGPPARTVFKSARMRPFAYGATSGIASLIFLGMSGTFSTRSAEGVALFLVAGVLGVVALAALWTAFRRRSVVEVSDLGIVVSRPKRRLRVDWDRIDTVRVVSGITGRPWLVVSPRVGGGGLGSPGSEARIAPVAHWVGHRSRVRQVTELRAALAWFGGSIYDSRP